MTPAEKAKELTNKYLKSVVMIRRAKQCALICVDELIKFTIEKKEESMYFEMDLKYLQEVKQELLKQ